MMGEIVARVVRALEGYYRVEGEDPRPFVTAHEDEELREVLLVREGDDDDVEIRHPAAHEGRRRPGENGKAAQAREYLVGHSAAHARAAAGG